MSEQSNKPHTDQFEQPVASTNTSLTQDQFEDPGVSNGDVDWLFRGKAVKKLSRKSHVISNDVKNHLPSTSTTATTTAPAPAIGTTTTPTTTSASGTASHIEKSGIDGVPRSTSTASNIDSAIAPSLSTSTQQPTLKPSLKITTQQAVPLPPSSPPKTEPPVTPVLSTHETQVQSSVSRSGSLKASVNSPQTPTPQVASSSSSASAPPSRSRASSIGSLKGRSRSTSDASKEKQSPVATAAKKPSIFSSLSSKFKGSSVQQTQAPSPTQQSANTVSSPSTAPSTPAMTLGSQQQQHSQPSPQATESQSQPKSGLRSLSRSSSLSKKEAPVMTPSPQTPATATAASVSSEHPDSKSLFGLRKIISSSIQTQAGGSSSRRSSVASLPPQPAPQPRQPPKDPLSTVSFKRVTFALQNLPDDPQQQIPSRRPRKGNVLIPEDLLSPPAKLSIGITDSFNNQASGDKPQVDQRILMEAEERHQLALMEARKHSLEAHASAVRIAKEVAGFKKAKHSKDSNDEIAFGAGGASGVEGWGVSGKLSELSKSGLDIDTPIHEHVNYFDSPRDHPETTAEEEVSEGEDDVPAATELSLDLLYTRCCHLREILPIPATLKQLKHKTRPLHVLKMLNPKPTLIDILSFSDFLAIAPIVTVIFDNVTIDNQMLKIVLVSLSNSTTLEKLSLRNVAIDTEGWLSICKFLTVNKSISKLDISQQKIKADTPRKFHRSEMNWDLFTTSLMMKGGLEELVINGCKLTTPQFKNLVENGLSIKTKRLGLASTNLDLDKTSILADWISSPGNCCVGIDIAFNDLSSSNQLTPLKEAFKNKMENIKLIFFSLNQTNVSVPEVTSLLEYLSNSKTLRFLDLGNNPQLFPGILPALSEYLPKFPDLRRVHFEFDELSEAAIMQLCLTFHKCNKLIHVSLLGNTNITYRTSAALYIAVKQSNIYNLDIDYDLVGDELSSKIAFYLMKNMEKFITGDKSTNVDEEDLIFDGSLLTKSAETLLESNEIKNDEEKQVISNALVQKTIRLRNEIHKTMNKLFEAREKGRLSLEGKENLLRFCLLDDSLESIIHIFSEEGNATSHSDDEAQLQAEIKQQEQQKLLLQQQQKQQQQLQVKEEMQKPSVSAAPAVAITSSSNSTNSLPKRPELIKTLSSQLPMHESSSDVIFTGPIVSPQQTIATYIDEQIPHPLSHLHPSSSHHMDHSGVGGIEDAAPHQVVVDSMDKPIDHLTGQPVLIRRVSQTSIHAKELEEEEGEFHRWGFFVQQQNSMMPNDQQKPAIHAPQQQQHSQPAAQHPPQQAQPLKVTSNPASTTTAKPQLKINNIPSGPQLRQAVIKAKGIESVSDLIGKINKDMSQIQSIYDQQPDGSTGVNTATTNTPAIQTPENGRSSMVNSPKIGPTTATSTTTNTTAVGTNSGTSTPFKIAVSSALEKEQLKQQEMDEKDTKRHHHFHLPHVHLTSHGQQQQSNPSSMDPKAKAPHMHPNLPTHQPKSPVSAAVTSNTTAEHRSRSSTSESSGRKNSIAYVLREDGSMRVNPQQSHHQDSEDEPVSPISVNSMDHYFVSDHHHDHHEVQADEVYEKLLDDVARVRSNRSLHSDNSGA